MDKTVEHADRRGWHKGTRAPPKGVRVKRLPGEESYAGTTVTGDLWVQLLLLRRRLRELATDYRGGQRAGIGPGGDSVAVSAFGHPPRTGNGVAGTRMTESRHRHRSSSATPERGCWARSKGSSYAVVEGLVRDGGSDRGKTRATNGRVCSGSARDGKTHTAAATRTKENTEIITIVRRVFENDSGSKSGRAEPAYLRVCIFVGVITRRRRARSEFASPAETGLNDLVDGAPPLRPSRLGDKALSAAYRGSVFANVDRRPLQSDFFFIILSLSLATNFLRLLFIFLTLPARVDRACVCVVRERKTYQFFIIAVDNMSEQYTYLDSLLSSYSTMYFKMVDVRYFSKTIFLYGD